MQIIKRRKWFYALSLIIIIPGLISLFLQGLNLGIDFTGGSITHIKLPSQVTTAEVREVLEKQGLEKAEVQKSGDEFYLRTSELTQEETDELMAALKEEFSEVVFMSAESVGATIGGELTRNAILAISIAAVLMLIYISFRFEWTFGIASIVSILHNVLVVLGAFSLFQWEVNSAFIAAILTVIGYSINDTIVIFDRVRENMRGTRKQDYEDLVNRSVAQTLTRSVNTVLTSIFPLVALLILGGSTIKLFVLAMLIGFVVGCYSSICIASSTWYEIKTSRAAA
ncbi:MAG TPA: protein translocase subunit SecF [Syntrophomonadaceae bacterium]|nr:protein translocase subunit SecF [Syntrophomonadaceae bacterium]HPU48139.1 protein translocase subunit SecF [Syntrophomonadaceae bacterium]